MTTLLPRFVVKTVAVRYGGRDPAGVKTPTAVGPKIKKTALEEDQSLEERLG